MDDVACSDCTTQKYRILIMFQLLEKKSKVLYMMPNCETWAQCRDLVL